VTNANGTITTYSLVDYFNYLHTSDSRLGVFYVFETQQDFITYAQANFTATAQRSAVGFPTLAKIQGNFGYTASSASTGLPFYTVVFAKVKPTVPNLSTGTTAAHELGHWMNRGFAWVTGSTPNSGLSSSSQFNDELANDYTYANSRQKCGTGSPNGMFYGYADDSAYPGAGQTERYICSGQTGLGASINTASGSPYLATDDNRTILLKAWDYFFTSSVDSKGELLSEEYGAGSGLDGKADTATAPNQVDTYFGYHDSRDFECTRAFIRFVVRNAAIPTVTNHGSSWPTNSNGTTRCTLY
jgi:hypothetical protein